MYEWASVKDFIVDYILCSDSTLREPAMKALGKFSNLVNDDQGMMEIMERMTPVVLQVRFMFTLNIFLDNALEKR